jgi:hypothetical protein
LTAAGLLLIGFVIGGPFWLGLAALGVVGAARAVWRMAERWL